MSLNRIISLVLVIVLTIPICQQTNLFAKSAELSNLLRVNKTDADNEAVISSELDFEFDSRSEEIKNLIKAAEANGDTEIKAQVRTVFSQLYSLLKKIILSDGDLQSEDVGRELGAIFNSLFILDTKLNKADPNAMGELTNKGFVTQAVSIVWDIMDAFDENRLSSQTMEKGVTRIEDIPYIDDGTDEHMLEIGRAHV